MNAQETAILKAKIKVYNEQSFLLGLKQERDLLVEKLSLENSYRDEVELMKEVKRKNHLINLTESNVKKYQANLSQLQKHYEKSIS